MTAHLLDSLHSAARLAIAHGNDLSNIRTDHWCVTYRCSPDQIAEAFRLAENGKRKLPEEVAASSPKAIEVQEDEG